jgi:hypothetical protein
MSDVGGKVKEKDAIHYGRRVEHFLTFTKSHASPQKSLNLRTVEHYNARFGKGASWRKNTYHFLIKFSVYLQYTGEISEEYVNSFRDSTKGVIGVLGREIKKSALRKQNAKRPALLQFDPNDFINNQFMVKAIKGITH